MILVEPDLADNTTHLIYSSLCHRYNTIHPLLLIRLARHLQRIRRSTDDNRVAVQDRFDRSDTIRLEC
jgi:hypothetical protein